MVQAHGIVDNKEDIPWTISRGRYLAIRFPARTNASALKTAVPLQPTAMASACRITSPTGLHFTQAEHTA